MKRVVIVHCWDGYPDYCWYPYAKRELTKKGFAVTVPAFPETAKPDLEKWLPVLKDAVGVPDENTNLIGHSIGCATILRYLESLREGEKVGGVVLVAGFTENVGYDELKSFFTTPINFEKVRASAKGFVAIHSDNDQYVDLTYADIFKNKLGAEIIIKHDAGHFSGSVENEASCLELPDVVTSIEKLSRL